MGYRMDNVFIKKMCIEKATDKYDNQFVLKKLFLVQIINYLLMGNIEI